MYTYSIMLQILKVLLAMGLSKLNDRHTFRVIEQKYVILFTIHA